MPTARKRALQEVDSSNGQPPKPPSTLHRIRNMWQFANLYQFITLFGKPLKMDDNLDIEDLETECLKPGAAALQDIGLGFLKFISSHRGLTLELFDEYTRRQFLAKAPEKNPFGTEESPARFADFDVFTKIRVLHHMSQIILMNPERLREKTEEQKDADQTSWRIEPYGWDREDRTYFVLDDNRIYRLTEAPPPPAPKPKPKKNSKKAKAARRSNKRRRMSAAASSEAEDAGDEASENGAPAEAEDEGLGGMKWECVAVTIDEVRHFLSGIRNTKDSNEKILRDQIQDHLVPILEKQEESRKRKQLQREKELLNLEKMAHAKRSSRIASKIEQQKADEHSREEDRKRHDEEVARRKEEAQRIKLEREREKRLMSREKRLKEREVRRLQHEEELAQLSEDSKSTGTGPGRMSERRRLAEIEKNKLALKEIEEEEDDWIFDCVCGVYGQIDDGTHSVACERCNVWQHSNCLGIAEEEAEKDDFHFVCNPCRKHEEAGRDQQPRIIKLKINRPGSSPFSSPQKAGGKGTSAQLSAEPQLVVEPQPKSVARPNGGHDDQITNGPQRSFQAESSQVVHSSSLGIEPRDASAKTSPNGPENNPFSSPHPNLSPPDSLDKSGSYGTIFDRPNPVPVKPPMRSEPGDDGTRPSTGAFSALAGSGSLLPSPQPQRLPSPPTTKTSPTAAVTTTEIGHAVSPQFTPAQSYPRSDGGQMSSPLPPSQGGLSPTKQSPPVPRHQANGNATSTATPSAVSNPLATVFPPAAALSLSPAQEVPTPPVKSTEPARESTVAGESLH